MPHITLNSDEPGIRGLLTGRRRAADQRTGGGAAAWPEHPDPRRAGTDRGVRVGTERVPVLHGLAFGHRRGPAARRNALVEQVRADADAAPVSAKLKALLAIAAAVQRSGRDVTADLVAQARATGATDLELHDTVLIAAAFCMMNRYVDGLATIAPEDPAVYAAGARRLISQGYLPPSAAPSPQG